MKRLLLLTLLCTVSSCPVHASQEEFLPWSSVVIKSAFRDQPDIVTVTATVNGPEFSELSIEAFGRTTTLTDADLKKLSGCLLSTCRLTHEPGYRLLGGHTVHLRLTRPPNMLPGQTQEQQILVSVPKNAPLEISVR
jgi:hypothetical protein